jgi:uncharacterized membrane protein
MSASKSSRARNARAAQRAAQARARSVGSGGTGVAVKDAGAPRGATARGASTAKKGPAAAAVVAPPRAGQVRRQPAGDDLAEPRTGRGPAVWLQITTFVLALVGLGVSTYLTVAHFTQAALIGCAETKGLVDCGKVTTSPQSYVFGIPVAVLGLVFYVFVVAIMSPWAWRMTRREVHMLRIAAMVAGIGFVLYLLYAELFIIGNICLYCSSVHIITFLLFVLTMFAAAAWGLKPGAAWPQRLTPRNLAGRRQARQAAS